MLKNIAGYFSLIFHPLFMPSYGIILLLNFGGYFDYLPSKYQWYVYAIVWVFTLGFPLLMLYLFKKIGKISTYNIPDRQERILPMAMILLSYGAVVVLFTRMHVPSLIMRYFVGLVVVLGVISLVSLWWKISAHMAGAGGFIAAAIIYGLFLRMNISPLIILFVILAGLIGWARLALSAHTQAELLSGFCVGFGIMGLITSGVVI